MSAGTAITETVTPAATRGARRRPAPLWIDRFLGSDPGLNRLKSALQAVTTIGLAMLAEWIFVHGTHALWLEAPAGVTLPAAQSAVLGAQHHGITVIAIMLGAIVGLLSAFGAQMFASRRQLACNTILIPVPMAIGLAIGLSLGNHRVAALTSLVVILTLGTYARRFGPSGFLGGQLVFMGDFFGFFLHTEIGLGDIGWLLAEIGVGTLVATIAQFTIFFPSRSAALRRMVRSYAARERDVSGRALEVFDAADAEARAGASRVLHRRLARLNETALMIDAHLAQPGSIPEHWSPAELHQRLFDSELSLTNVCRFAERLGVRALPADVHDGVRSALAAVHEIDLLAASTAARQLLRRLPDVEAERRDGGSELDRADLIVLHRYAMSVLAFVEAAEGWRVAILTGNRSGEDERTPFATSVLLFGGWLPGSTIVSAAASMEAGTRRAERLTLPPYVRTAIQMGVAVTLAIVLGDVLSGRRFYWAVIAAFVTFMGANNAGEQIRKGTLRLLGTVVGVFLGAVGAHAVGHHTSFAIVLILVALFFGLYLMRISYAFMVIGITIMVSQLYVQLDEFSDSLLLLRLEETAIGAAAAVLTVVCVLPLRTGRVARVAARQYLQSLSTFVGAAVARLAVESADAELRSAARDVDAAFQTLSTTLLPLQTPFLLRPDALRERLIYSVAASRNYARNLVVDARSDSGVPECARAALAAAGEQLTASIDEVVAANQNNDARSRTYVRSAALFELVAHEIGDRAVTSPSQLALRDLQLIDGALAGFAEGIGMTVDALDTRDGEAAALAVVDAAR